jgi:magnesium chelatase family protein
MAMASTLSRAQQGMEAHLVRVEVDLASGLPRFAIVGLPEAVVKESRDRVRAAITNSNLTMPEGRVTVSLSPADLRKEGNRFDLPIAFAILLASGQVPAESFTECELYGELSLGGELMPMKGALLVALEAKRYGHKLVVPAANLSEAMLVPGCKVAPASTLMEIFDHAHGRKPLQFVCGDSPQSMPSRYPDLRDVRGQAQAKRALEIAAAGSHSLLLIGPPGTGKSMLAQRLPGLLPLMSEKEALDSAAIRNAAGLPLKPSEWRVRPFRSPHHTSSGVALVGGGSLPRPGEISLAHNGVLFLDELPEFDRSVLEVLREPLESGSITISRAARQCEYQAVFQFVAAMNPCPCGYLGDALGQCRCTVDQVARYRSRVSGPLLDRLDLHVEVPRVPAHVMRAKTPDAEATTEVRERVVRARQLQTARQGVPNARLADAALERFCPATERASGLLERASSKLALSARAYNRVRRVARTIADLAQVEEIDTNQMSEAIALRALDRGRP